MEKRFRVTVDGREYQVSVEALDEGAGQLYPKPGSMNIPVEVTTAEPNPSSPVAPKAPLAAAGSGDIVSTVGGVVQAILISVGQQVSSGDKVAVVEAMKMKTPMIASRTGKVASIAVKPGDSVEAGQILMTLD